MKILIADDHNLIRKGMVSILTSAFPSIEITEAESGEKVLQFAHQDHYDLIIMDVHMNTFNGLEVLKQLRQTDRDAGVLVVSLQSDDHFGVRALKSGADGYLTKSCTPDDLINAVHAITGGKKFITSPVAEKLAGTSGSKPLSMAHETLSDREFDVLRMIASGKQVSQIASDLHLSVPTVSTYRARLLNKMGMKNNAELTHYAISHHLV